jgi:tetratricopeptide (TPR) repeat protein
MRRAGAPGGDKHDYTRVVDNLNYVIQRGDPRCPLLPDVYFQKGTALERLGDREAAVSEYQSALRVAAGYTPARAALVQVYLDRGDLKAARAALAEGLKHDPRSKTLAEKKGALDARETTPR